MKYLLLVFWFDDIWLVFAQASSELFRKLTFVDLYFSLNTIIQYTQYKNTHVIKAAGNVKGILLQNLNTALKKNYPEGVDVVYESVGGETYETCVNRLANKGRLIVIGYISGYQDAMGVGSTKFAR